MICANEREYVMSCMMIRDTYKSLTEGKDMWKGHVKSDAAIRWRVNLKTNDRSTGGQISPAAEAVGPETATGEVGGGWGTVID